MNDKGECVMKGDDIAKMPHEERVKLFSSLGTSLKAEGMGELDAQYRSHLKRFVCIVP